MVNRPVVLAAGAGLAAIGRSAAMAQEATPLSVPDVPNDFKVVLHAAQ